MSCSWTPAWAGRAIPSSARARSTRSCPPRAPTAGRSLRRQRASPSYRHRKEEAERKLERTEENLLRIGDKIDELELQVEPLRAQAETAQTYLRCRDELRILELSLWLEQLEGLRNTKRKLLSDTEHATQQRESAADARGTALRPSGGAGGADAPAGAGSGHPAARGDGADGGHPNPGVPLGRPGPASFRAAPSRRSSWSRSLPSSRSERIRWPHRSPSSQQRLTQLDAAAKQPGGTKSRPRSPVRPVQKGS